MADNKRSSFDFRDEDLQGDQFHSARAPSATATDLRDTTRSALSGPGRQVNSAVSPFSQPDPYPNRRTAPQVPDRSGSNVVYIGGDPNDKVTAAREHTASLFAQARNTRKGADRSALLREAIASSQFDRSALDAQTTTEQGALRRQSAGDIANVNAQVDTNIANVRDRTARTLGIMDSLDRRFDVDTRDRRSRLNAELSAETSRANNRDSLLGRALEGQADRGVRTRGLDLEERRLDQNDAAALTGSYSLRDHMNNVASGGIVAGSDTERQSLMSAYAGARSEPERQQILMLLDESAQASAVPGGFEGGLVTPMGFDNPVGLNEGGVVPPGPGAPPALGPITPQQPDPALIAKYTQYAEGSKAMGLNTVGFEEFASMAQGAQATAGTSPAPTGAGAPVQLAEGGPVPAGGKMVIDPDPNAPTDSIPAVIDGQTPAALDSGELVFPRHAVLYYGTDKLNKMIAKSKEAQEGGNGESATGLNG